MIGEGAGDPVVIAQILTTTEDWLTGFRLARRRQPGRWTVPSMSLVVAGWAALAHDWVLAIVFAGLTAGYDSLVMRGYRATVRKTYRDDLAVTVTSWGIGTVTPIRRGEIAWSALDEAIESASLLVFRSSIRDVIVVPKAQLSEAQREAIAIAFGRSKRWHVLTGSAR